MSEEQFEKINIQWFPGHMTKAKREMQEKLSMVDMVIELRDARIPNASKNPMVEELCKQKPRLILLSKKDKADANETMRWVKQLSQENTNVIALDLIKENIVPKVVNASKELMKPKIDRMLRRGIRPRAIRAMVVGVPNVGKSTFINRIAKKKVAQTGDRPGVTRSLQWAKVNQDLELLDTPGVLWPKFEDPKVGLYLAVTGAIRDEILPLEEVCRWALLFLLKHHPEKIQERFQVELCEDPYELLLRIAHARKFYRSGQEVDEKRTIEMVLREIRDDRMGAITWELCDEVRE